NLGWLLEHDKNYSLVRRHREEAIKHLQRCRQLDPQQGPVLEELRKQHRSLAEVNVQLKNPAEAARQARARGEIFPGGPEDAYYAACFLSRCIPLSDDGEAKRFAKDAVAFLHKATPAMARVNRLPNEAEVFQVLEGNEDFQELKKQWK